MKHKKIMSLTWKWYWVHCSLEVLHLPHIWENVSVSLVYWVIPHISVLVAISKPLTSFWDQRDLQDNFEEFMTSWDGKRSCCQCFQNITSLCNFSTSRKIVIDTVARVPTRHDNLRIRWAFILIDTVINTE